MDRQVDVEFTRFVQTRQPALLRSAFLLTGDRASAEDLVQEALIKLARRWDTVRKDRPEAYVRTVLYHDAVSRWRRARHEVMAGWVEPVPTVAPQDDWVSGADLRAALQRLPAGQRAVLVLRYLEDLTEQSVAEVLGVSVGTVKRQAHDGLANLRVQLPVAADVFSDPGDPGEHARRSAWAGGRPAVAGAGQPWPPRSTAKAS